jgi:hypothetical protein
MPNTTNQITDTIASPDARPDLPGQFEQWIRRVKRGIDYVNGDLLLKLGDSAGLNKIRVMDGYGNEAGSIDSTGAIRGLGMATTGQVPITAVAPWSTVASVAPLYEMDRDGNVVFGGGFFGASGAAFGTIGAHILAGETWVWASNKDDGYGDVRLDYTNGAFGPGVAASASYYLTGSHKYRMGSARAWTTPTGTNNWQSYAAGGFTTPGYFVSSDGVVTLKGAWKNAVPGNVGLSVFTLPLGARPARYQRFLVNCNNLRALIDIRPDGTVNCVFNAAGGFLSLDGIEFLASWSPIRFNTMQLATGWSHQDAPGFATWDPGGFSIDANRWVRLHGLVSGGTINTPVTILPPGCRPATTARYFATVCGGEVLSRVTIYPDGRVMPEVMASNAYLVLQGAKFLAAAY